MKWLSDKKNNIIQWVDKNSKRVEGILRKKFKLPGVMIRAHTNKKSLIIMGRFTENIIREVEKYVSEKSGFKAVVYNEKSS